jgi:hypothetical protein
MIELRRLDYIPPELEALDFAIKLSPEKWGAWNDRGEWIIAWGIVPQSLLSDRAYLWSLGNVGVLCRHKRDLLRISRRVVGDFLTRYSVLFGTSRRTTCFLDHLGAVWGETDSAGFTQFEIRRR